MTEKRFIEPNKECRVIRNIKTGETATYYDTEDGLMFLKWLNNLSEENEQLQKKNDNLVNMTARVQYRADQRKEENEQLKKQLDYIQNSINTHIKHQKTELGQKALKEIIKDYNEWLIGHKGE